MKKISILLFLLMLFALSMQAQTNILKKFVQKVQSYKSINYTVITNNESPFGDSADTIQTYQGSNKVYQLQYEFKTAHTRDIFDGKTLLSINFTNKYYAIKNNNKWHNNALDCIPIFKLIDIVNVAFKTPEKIKSLPDTTIQKTSCYHIQITKDDSVIRNKRSYSIFQLYINKTNFLPVCAEMNMQGYLSKGNVESEDVYKLRGISYYSNYRTNLSRTLNTADIGIPADFLTLDQYNNKGKKPVPLLAAGIKAPDWDLQDLEGGRLSSNDTKNKVVLIDFFGDYCAPCIMSIPAIERLHERYKSDAIEIISVDIDDGKAIPSKFAAKYKLKYPTYINGKSMSNYFHVTAIPTFYIIDKQGNIVSAYDGYSDDLEQKLITQINKLK